MSRSHAEMRYEMIDRESQQSYYGRVGGECSMLRNSAIFVVLTPALPTYAGSRAPRRFIVTPLLRRRDDASHAQIIPLITCGRRYVRRATCTTETGARGHGACTRCQVLATECFASICALVPCRRVAGHGGGAVIRRGTRFLFRQAIFQRYADFPRSVAFHARNDASFRE